MAHTSTQRLILDLDSSESPVHGEQEGAKYNGHYGSVCYHASFCFNQFGDCEGAMLREGNVSSADSWRELLNPIVKRYANSAVRKQFRGDAGFARPEIYEYLEQHGFLYAIRLLANDVLERKLALWPGAAGAVEARQSGGDLRRLRLPGGDVEGAPPGSGQDRMACWRVVPADRLHRDQSR